MYRILSLSLLLCATGAYAQQTIPTPQAAAVLQTFMGLPNAHDTLLQSVSSSDGRANHTAAPTKPDIQTAPPPQPKRILGIMPNYRAVSAGTIPPPPTAKVAFGIATRNSFDYSAFIFTGLTSMIAEGDNDHPQLGKGVPGFWGYSWRGFLDKTDGNYWVIFVLPTAFHEDARYFALGRGSILKRAAYSTTRIFVARDYQGHNTINGAELLGRGIAQGISTTYYPSQDRTASDLASKYAYSLLRDAATDAFREFWPDIATHVLHHHP